MVPVDSTTGAQTTMEDLQAHGEKGLYVKGKDILLGVIHVGRGDADVMKRAEFDAC